MNKLLRLLLVVTTLLFIIPDFLQAEPSVRKVIVTFDRPSEGPAVKGSLVIAYIDVSKNKPTISIKESPVIGEKCEFTVPVPTRIGLSPDKLTGYCFDVTKNQYIGTDDDPEELNLKLRYAGSISGTLLDASGKPLNRDIVLAGVYSKNNIWVDTHNDFVRTYAVPVKNGHFTISPIPLSGFRKYYALFADQGNLAISEPVHLEESQPTGQIQLQFKPGKKITGVLQDEQHRPIANQQLILNYQIDKKHLDAVLPSLKTKADGSFEIPSVNFDTDGGIFAGYYIQLPKSKLYHGQSVGFDEQTEMPLIITAEAQDND